MIKKHKFEKKKQTDQVREQLKALEDLPLVGGFVKGLEKFIDIAEKVEEAGGEIRKEGEIKGLGSRPEAKGIYGFSIRTGIGGRPQVQTFGNIRPVGRRVGKKPAKGWSASGGEVRVTETREPMVDVFDEKDHILIIAELPGVSEDSIILDIKGDILTLEAGDEKRKYSKEILLPAKVDFGSKEESFKNGILEVKIKKLKRET